MTFYRLLKKIKTWYISNLIIWNKKSYRFHRRNHKDTLGDIKKIYNWVKPDGGLQERTLSLLSVLGIAGPDFIDHILHEIEYTSDHRIIIVD